MSNVKRLESVIVEIQKALDHNKIFLAGLALDDHKYPCFYSQLTGQILAEPYQNEPIFPARIVEGQLFVDFYQM